jgi:hypothetical protein
MSLLKKIPDAKGTHAYLDVLRSLIDSFLDKKLDKLTRINSWATGPVKSRSILEYHFASSYLWFGTCYVDENTTI